MKRRSDPLQLTIDWTAAAAVAPASPAVQPIASPEPPAIAGAADVSGLMQILPWDFQTTFPPVLQDAVDAGVLAEEDALPENLASLHVDHAAALLAALTDLATIHEARRQGVDPATGRPPRKPEKKSELKARLDHEIERLQRWWQTLLDTYEGAFGTEAAAAFDKCVRARHAGIAVITDGRPVPVAVVPTLPAPKALRRAVNAAVFGRDENGPVDPGSEEVQEITENHAELMIALVESFRRAGQSPAAEAAGIQEAMQLYADDFGQRAADQLLAYCRRQAVLNNAESFHAPCHA